MVTQGNAGMNPVGAPDRTPFTAGTGRSTDEIVAAADLLDNLGYRASYTHFRDLFGIRPQGDAATLLDQMSRTRYGKNRFWKLDGVDPAVRERARCAAWLQSQRLGPWREQAVRETLEYENYKI